jgi:hypothetical protein
MIRRLLLLSVAVVVVAAAAYLIYARSNAARTNGAGSAAGHVRVLLNEILFQPASGSTFVELWNAGGDSVRLDGYTLVNQADARYA